MTKFFIIIMLVLCTVCASAPETVRVRFDHSVFGWVEDHKTLITIALSFVTVVLTIVLVLLTIYAMSPPKFLTIFLDKLYLKRTVKLLRNPPKKIAIRAIRRLTRLQKNRTVFTLSGSFIGAYYHSTIVVKQLQEPDACGQEWLSIALDRNARLSEFLVSTRVVIILLLPATETIQERMHAYIDAFRGAARSCINIDHPQFGPIAFVEYTIKGADTREPLLSTLKEKGILDCTTTNLIVYKPYKKSKIVFRITLREFIRLFPPSS